MDFVCSDCGEGYAKLQDFDDHKCTGPKKPSPVNRVISFTARKKKMCRHDEVIVDEFNRHLECDLCGGIIDPFDYLNMLAHKEDGLKFRLQGLREDILQAKADLISLKLEKKNLSASVRRLRKIR